MKRIAIALAGFTVLALAATGTGIAQAVPASTTCTSVLVAGTYRDVVVPTGASCIIQAGVTIEHDLIATSPSFLVIGDVAAPVRVGHDFTLTANGPASIYLVCNTAIGHDLIFRGGAAGGTGIGGAPVCAVSAGHDLSVVGAQTLEIRNATAGHDLVVRNNLGAFVTVVNNRAGHDALCSGNGNFGGSGNTAGHLNTCNS